MPSSPLLDQTSSVLDADGRLLLGPEEARALLRTCFVKYATKLGEMAHASLDMTSDLFDVQSEVPDGEVEAFRHKRGEWLERFTKTLSELFERRLAGQRRQGRRPDADASARTLRVLTAFDHEKQAALSAAASALTRFSRRELAALDLRVAALLDERLVQELDNPFAIAYLLDAMGSTSRAVYPNPSVWRPLMERLLADMTPGIGKVFISLNRLLADRGVLPDIKAALRARSEHRPQDDRDLFATFTKLLVETKPAAVPDIAVPELLATPGAPPALDFARDTPAAVAGSATGGPTMDAQTILDRLTALANAGLRPAGNDAAYTGGPRPEGQATAHGEHGDPAFPSLDPLMALGTSTALFATLAQWQKLDLAAALASGGTDAARPGGVPSGSAGAMVPLNLVPHIRAAIAGQMSNETDPITMDVIALLFDYIFRDPSIPESTRALFARLQVPIVKAALLDRSFFSDRGHPARRLLDHLADAAVGAASDERYRESFMQVATDVIDRICADFEIDVAVFKSADARLSEFVEAERSTTSTALFGEVAAALAAEESEADRSAARATIRDRLAGTDTPFEVRSFIETTWSEYLADVHRQHGEDSAPWNAALSTLDDLLWSIVVKERAGQKARLTKMIPGLVVGLRKACVALQVPPDRSRAFFETLYNLHMAAIRPPHPVPPPAVPDAAALDASAPRAVAPESAGTGGVAPDSAAQGSAAPEGAAPDVIPAAPTPPVNVHDYVSEMAVGTWLAFLQAEETVTARLTWVSPLRTKYIFTSRSRARAFVRAPEELAYELGSGKASLLVEPVPLWDRAVSSALDAIAARRPPGAEAPPAQPHAA